MSAETPVQSAGNLTRLRLRFRDWRGTWPFWAGLFTLLGGIPIAYFPYATLKLGHMSIAMATTAGAGSLIIGVLLITLGLTMWFQPGRPGGGRGPCWWCRGRRAANRR
ncbi:hypothetical protein SGRIM128S_00182 [Streptomyces griseomycini]